MKLFNIISESKSFLFLLLFTFTLVTTTQSFASSKNKTDDELCGVESLTKLDAEDKKKCKTWCENNWTDTIEKKCLAIDAIKPAPSFEGIDVLSKLTEDDVTKITVPATITNMYKVDFTIGKELRAKLFDAYKAKSTTTTTSTFKQKIFTT